MAKKNGHHGGAWKVAYADFVTAMMALFIVLWLTSQDQRIKEAVARAFAHPFASLTKESVGIIPNTNMQATKSQLRGILIRRRRWNWPCCAGSTRIF
jgi:chemotaxis protein MotB